VDEEQDRVDREEGQLAYPEGDRAPPLPPRSTKGCRSHATASLP
jgi:hypothetical protein